MGLLGAVGRLLAVLVGVMVLIEVLAAWAAGTRRRRLRQWLHERRAALIVPPR